MQFHFKQGFHQLRIWVTTNKAQLDERDLNFYCWRLKKKILPRKVDVSIAPTDIVDLISCNCKGKGKVFCIAYFTVINKSLFQSTKIEYIMHMGVN